MRRRHFLGAGLGSGFLAGPLAACGQPASPVPAPGRETEGLDAALSAEALALARTLPKLHTLIVARDGQPLIEQVFRGPDLDAAVNIKSASKSVLAAVAGAAIGAGILTGVDQTVSPFLSNRFPSDPDPRLQTITLGHLLSMRAGLPQPRARTTGPGCRARTGSATLWLSRSRAIRAGR